MYVETALCIFFVEYFLVKYLNVSDILRQCYRNLEMEYLAFQQMMTDNLLPPVRRGQILYYIDPSIREKLSLNMKTSSSDRCIRHWAVLRWFSVVLEAFNYRRDFVVEVEEQYRASGTQVGTFLPLSFLLYNSPARWPLFSILEMSKLKL